MDNEPLWDPEFDKDWYLAQYPDVARAVEDGRIASAWVHWNAHGRNEGRIGRPGQKPAPQSLAADAPSSLSPEPAASEPAKRVEPLPPAPASPNANGPAKAPTLSPFGEDVSMQAVAATAAGSAFLSPQDLVVTPTSLNRVLIVGSCLADCWGFQSANPSECGVDFVLANNLAELPKDPPQAPEAYDFQIVQIPLRAIFRDDGLWHLKYADLADYERAFEEVCTRLSLQLASLLRWSVAYKIETFVANFLLPQEDTTGRLLPRYDLRNIVFFVESLNRKLETMLGQYANVHLLDIDKIAASFGRRHIQDDVIAAVSHNAVLPDLEEVTSRIEPMAPLAEHYTRRWSPDFTTAIWHEVLAMHRTLNRIDAVKLVVVDLDDTLWNGVSGEATAGPEMIEGWPLGLAEALAYLKKRGILLAIISKNDMARVKEIWPRILGERLALSDFASIKINWQPKSANMRELLAETNILPQNVVFIDDNPVERATIRYMFPTIRVLGRYPYYLRRILLWSAETQVPYISSESGSRTEMVKAQIDRDTFGKTVSREEFLASLNLKLRAHEIMGEKDPCFSRAFELLNKTNQFNTTGRRWKREDCVRGLAEGKRFFCFGVEDRFTNYGLAGLLITDASCVEQTVMSCRIIGLDAELAMLQAVVGKLATGGKIDIRAAFEKTAANSVCESLFERSGFVKEEASWRLSKAMAAPPHITVTWL